MTVDPIYIWLGLTILFAVVEAISAGLTSIWFALGALAGMISSAIGLSVATQIVIAILVAALSLIFTRRIAKNYFKIGGEKTNADRIIGETGLVIQKIDNIAETGQIKLKGQIWTARAKNAELIEADERVRVVEIVGVRAIVERL